VSLIYHLKIRYYDRKNTIKNRGELSVVKKEIEPSLEFPESAAIDIARRSRNMKHKKSV
jgi:hypothetical protein